MDSDMMATRIFAMLLTYGGDMAEERLCCDMAFHLSSEPWSQTIISVVIMLNAHVEVGNGISNLTSCRVDGRRYLLPSNHVLDPILEL